MSTRAFLRAAIVTFSLAACAGEVAPVDARCDESRACTDSLAQTRTDPLPFQTFRLQTGTPLHETGDNVTFVVAGNDDLFAIKKRNTGSGRTEVHILSAVSNYQRFSLQVATALHETGSDFEFGLNRNRDLVAIKKRSTGTDSTEVHILSAASGYREFTLQTGTALHETGDDFEFEVAGNGDLYAIKKYGTGSGKTEVHILSADSSYQQFTFHGATALHETDKTFTFLRTSLGSIYAIKKSATGTGSTEVHHLSPLTNYTTFGMQIGTLLHETDDTFEFAVTLNFDIIAIKKSRTSTGSTEVHILAWGPAVARPPGRGPN